VADLVTRDRAADTMRTPDARRAMRALGLLVALLCLACQSSGGGVGMDFSSDGPGWAPFTAGRMFGGPM
jgi:hypothetical protein